MARTVDCNGIARHISRGNILVATDNIFFSLSSAFYREEGKKEKRKEEKEGSGKNEQDPWRDALSRDGVVRRAEM